ncbi:C2 domain-containing protein [Syncephalastrum racemosum]|uniref:C2 domain-containing protein n=1 Tax=Syncephalastrum racemosum TaxID=13706 RepID=A0A1X2H713_SYNRA|nr:C2 domain-containing protein [Syncephalastrum racemosum]
MTETQKPPIGELVIVALRAIVGKQDPFCVFRLGEVAQRTKTDYRGGQHPLWDDQVNIPVPPNKTKLYMQLFDEDSHREDLISEGELDLTKVLREGEQDDWFPLSYRGRKAGEIYLELTFYSAVSSKKENTR